MHTLDAKMALWKEVYTQLKEARAKLKEARARNQDDPEIPHLAFEVDRLNRACGVALDAMQAELARLKDGGNSQSDSR